MPVQSVQANPGGGAATWTGIGNFPGLRVLVAVWDRAGGEQAGVESNDPGWNEGDFVLVADQVTLPLDGTHRRSAYLFESVVPAGIVTNPIITVVVLDGTANPVANSWVALAVDESGGSLVVPPGGADSGTSTTLSQGTGSTGAASAGDILLITVETSKGDTTHTWGTTTSTPVNPGGGNWDLSAMTGSGANQRRGSVGYVVLGAQPSQTWDDTVTYGTARTSTALIAAWDAGDVVIEGTLTAELPALGASLSGEAESEGDLTVGLPALAAAFAGEVVEDEVEGTLGAALPALAASLDAELQIDGALDASLPALEASLSGEVQDETEGTLTAVLPPLSGSFAGESVQEGVGELVASLPAMVGVFSGGRLTGPWTVDVRPHRGRTDQVFPVKWPREL